MTPVNIEVQYASELVIAAVERVGGVITTRYYDLLSVFAKSDPYAFFERGLPIPRGKKPPLVNHCRDSARSLSQTNGVFRNGTTKWLVFTVVLFAPYWERFLWVRLIRV